MRLRNFNLSSALLITALFTLPTNPAAAEDQRSNRLVGTWLMSLETGVPELPRIVAFFTFNRDGTVTQTQTLLHGNSTAIDPICGCSASPGHGIWRRKRRNVFEYEFRGLIFSGPNTSDFSLNLSEPILNTGQHIGFGVAGGTIRVRGNELTGLNLGGLNNLDGELLNPQVPFLESLFTGQRLGFK